MAILEKIKILLKVFLTRKESNIEKYLIPHLKTRENLIIVDVGAHKGLFIDQISDYVSIERAILIEPIPSNVDYLRNKYLYDKFIILQCAISDNEQEVQFIVNQFSETSSLFEFDTSVKQISNINTYKEDVILVQSRMLDQIFEDLSLKHVDLLKIDVQGAELLVILGGKKVLSDVRLIWVETSFIRLYKNSGLFHELCDLMRSLDFILIEIVSGYRSGNGEILQADLLFEFVGKD